MAALHELAPAPDVVPRPVTSSSVEAYRFPRTAIERAMRGSWPSAGRALSGRDIAGAAGLKIKPANTLDMVVLRRVGPRQAEGLAQQPSPRRSNEAGGLVLLGKTQGDDGRDARVQTTKLLELEVARDGITVYVRPRWLWRWRSTRCRRAPVSGGVALTVLPYQRYRSDKTADAADTMGSVQEIYREQRSGLASHFEHPPDFSLRSKCIVSLTLERIMRYLLTPAFILAACGRADTARDVQTDTAAVSAPAFGSSHVGVADRLLGNGQPRATTPGSTRAQQFTIEWPGRQTATSLEPSHSSGRRPMRQGGLHRRQHDRIRSEPHHSPTPSSRW